MKFMKYPINGKKKDDLLEGIEYCPLCGLAMQDPQQCEYCDYRQAGIGCLEEVLEEELVPEYEEAIDLWKTHGGD